MNDQHGIPAWACYILVAAYVIAIAAAAIVAASKAV